jgi:hypothetical protein
MAPAIGFSAPALLEIRMMSRRKIIRRPFATIAADLMPLALGGCWFSTSPILNAENASTVPFEGTYRDPDGTENHIVIARTGEGPAYTISQEDDIQHPFPGGG